VPDNTEKKGGIKCPACGTLENYAGKTNEGKPDNSIYRTKECKSCGTRFATVEVPIGIVEVKRRIRRTKAEMAAEQQQQQ
jgi:transcriptional regulator NrdR family protein